MGEHRGRADGDRRPRGLGAAFAMVGGIAAADVLCATMLGSHERRS